MNSVQLIGRATHDPQADTTTNGRAVTTFRLAVDRIGDGADFVTVKVWDRLATTVADYLTRGRRVALQGRLEHDEWTAADGQRAQRLTVVANRLQFLDPPPTHKGGHREKSSPQTQPDGVRSHPSPSPP